MTFSSSASLTLWFIKGVATCILEKYYYFWGLFLWTLYIFMPCWHIMNYLVYREWITKDFKHMHFLVINIWYDPIYREQNGIWLCTNLNVHVLLGYWDQYAYLICLGNRCAERIGWGDPKLYCYICMTDTWTSIMTRVKMTPEKNSLCTN